MRPTASDRLFVLGVLALVAACGGSGGGGGGGGGCGARTGATPRGTEGAFCMVEDPIPYCGEDVECRPVAPDNPYGSCTHAEPTPPDRERLPEGIACPGGHMESRDYGVVAWAWGDDACDVAHWCVCEATPGSADEEGELVQTCACRAPGIGVPCGDPNDRDHRRKAGCPSGLACEQAGARGQYVCVPMTPLVEAGAD